MFDDEKPAVPLPASKTDGKHTNRRLSGGDMAATLTALRGHKLTTPAAMMLTIIYESETKYDGGIYMGEIEAYYYSIAGSDSYGYSGMLAMMRSLRDRGYIKIEKDGQYNRYFLTTRGRRLVSTVKLEANL